MARKRGSALITSPSIPEELGFPGSVARRNVGYPKPIETKHPNFTQVPPSNSGGRITEDLKATPQEGVFKYADNYDEYL